eukprot:Skav231006  [mRNA]  locus=scaffold1196:14195:15168:+ [translate_table: standard]
MAAKPSIHACSFGNPPDPDKVTTYPGVARRYLPHEALIIYREKIYAERKAPNLAPGERWFKDSGRTDFAPQEHKRKQKEMEKLEKQIKDFRESRRPCRQQCGDIDFLILYGRIL